jgi:nitroreductase/NAD-dependent dihydropyrimidine dehydrogenase PreA subunit
MSWVTIDGDKCNQCGICVLRCMLCFREQDGEIVADANADNCNLCGHCISLCPTDAIVHDKMDMENFPPVDRSVAFDPDEFFQFIRSRRSQRHFKKREVPRAELEKLVEVCRFTPTGSNRQPVQVKVVQDPERIRRLSDLTVDYFVSFIEDIEKQVAGYRERGEPIPEELRLLQQRISLYKLIGAARELGLDVIFHQAPAVMIFHAEKMGSTPRDDCIIAATTVGLTAMTMGLGTCFIGLFTRASNDHPPLAEALRLPAGQQVYSVLVVGYPKLKFLRAVDRKPIPVTWE